MIYEYKHSKLKIIGMVGLICTVLLTLVLFPIFDVDFGTGIAVTAYAGMFGILIMVGLLNEM